MSEEKILQEFKLKNIDEAKTFFIEGINQNELMSKKHNKIYRVFNYTELQFLQLLDALFPFLLLLL